MAALSPFHLAIPVNDLDKAIEFYTKVLRCEEGRSTDAWADLNFFGHQVVLHRNPLHKGHSFASIVDGHSVPIPHFGLVLTWEEWEQMADELKKAGVTFVVEPYIRFKDKKGEQGTMFFLDPSGNALEFKAFKDPAKLFAK